MNTNNMQYFQARVKEAERRLIALATTLNVTVYDLRAHPEKFSDTVRALVKTILAEQIECLTHIVQDTPPPLPSVGTNGRNNVIDMSEWKRVHRRS